MNRVFLIGRITKDIELRHTQSNISVVQFTLAVNRPKQQDKEQEADFINCVVWDKLAENLAKYQAKGNQIAVEGRIQTRSYDDDKGNKRYVTEVVAERISYLQTKKDDNNFNSLVENVPSGSIKAEEIDDLPMSNDPFVSVTVDDSELPF